MFSSWHFEHNTHMLYVLRVIDAVITPPVHSGHEEMQSEHNLKSAMTHFFHPLGSSGRKLLAKHWHIFTFQVNMVNLQTLTCLLTHTELRNYSSCVFLSTIFALLWSPPTLQLLNAPLCPAAHLHLCPPAVGSSVGSELFKAFCWIQLPAVKT